MERTKKGKKGIIKNHDCESICFLSFSWCRLNAVWVSPWGIPRSSMLCTYPRTLVFWRLREGWFSPVSIIIVFLKHLCHALERDAWLHKQIKWYGVLAYIPVSLTRQREQAIPTLLDSWLRRGVLTSSVIRPEKQLHKLWGETVSECFTRSALVCGWWNIGNHR